MQTIRLRLLAPLAACLAIGASVRAEEAGSHVTGYALSPDRELLVQGDSKAGILIWDLNRIHGGFAAAWRENFSLRGNTRHARNLRFSSNGGAFLVITRMRGSDSNTLWIFSVADGVFESVDESVNDAFAAEFLDGRRVVVVKNDEVEIWNYGKGAVDAATPIRHGRALVLDASAHTAMVGTEDGTIWQWKLDDRPAKRLCRLGESIIDLALSGRGLVAVTENTIAQWNGRLKSRPREKGCEVPRSTNGELFLVAQKGSTLELTGTNGTTIRVHATRPPCFVPMLYDPEEKLLFAGIDLIRDSNQTAETAVFDVRSGFPAFELDRPTRIGYTSMSRITGRVRRRCRPGDGAALAGDAILAIASDQTIPAAERRDAVRQLIEESALRTTGEKLPLYRALRTLVLDGSAAERHLDLLTRHEAVDLIDALAATPPPDDSGGAARQALRHDVELAIREAPPDTDELLLNELASLIGDLDLEDCALQPADESCVPRLTKLAEDEIVDFRPQWLLVRAYVLAKDPTHAAIAAADFAYRFRFATNTDDPTFGCQENFLQWTLPVVDMP